MLPPQEVRLMCCLLLVPCGADEERRRQPYVCFDALLCESGKNQAAQIAAARERERERETERAVWGLNPCTIALVKERKTESLLSVKACFDILGSAAPFLHLC